MYVTKKHMARRTFLRGAGVTLALPLLESMVPALTPLRLTAAAPVKRFVGIWHPHGAAPGYWSPLQEGRDFDFSFITKPLEAFRSRVVLISGLDMPEAMATNDEPGGDHARGAVLLSGARPRRNAVSPYTGGTDDRSVESPGSTGHGHDTLVAAARRPKDSGNFGNCNLGLQLRVHELDLLGVADRASCRADQIPRAWCFERLFGVRHQLARSGGGIASAMRASSRRRRRAARSPLMRNLGAGGQGARRHLRREQYRELERRISDREWANAGQGARQRHSVRPCRRTARTFPA
jgi:hypothetical protein